MKSSLSCAAIVLTSFGLLDAAHAESRPRATDPLWQQECGSCHVPYPPRLLSAASWNTVMDGLGSHFGSDASLDPASTKAIRRFLTRHAGTHTTERQGKPLLRITETPWFVHEHSEELPAGIWKSPAVKSASNCSACHTQAAQGSFSEHEIRLPKGVSR